MKELADKTLSVATLKETEKILRQFYERAKEKAPEAFSEPA